MTAKMTGKNRVSIDNGVKNLFRRPLIPGLLFYAAGVLAILYAGSALMLILCAALCAVVTCVIATYIRRPCAFVFPALFCLGAILTAGSVTPKDKTVDGLVNSGHNFTLYGIVKDADFTKNDNQRVIIRCLEADGRKTDFNVSLYLRNAREVAIGEAFTLEAVLEPLKQPRFAGDFDEFAYYRARKIEYTAFASKIGETRSVEGGLFKTLKSFRARLAAVYDAVLPETEAAPAKSIVLGDKSGLGADTKDLYRAAGIYHILCVSGLHVTIISAAIYFLLKRFFGVKTRGFTALAFLAAYCVMTGASVPAVRALVMAAVVIFGKILRRETDPLSSLSFACLVLLIYEPMYLLDAGFQLSFSAVFGIASLAAPLTRAFHGKGARDKTAVAAGSSVAATLGLTPAICWHFYRFQVYSVLVNMIILPTTSVLVIMASVTSLAGLVSVNAAAFAAGPVYYLLKFYEKVCDIFTTLPGAQFLTGHGSLLLWALYGGGLAALAMWLSPRVRRKAAKWAFFGFSAAFLSVCAASVFAGGYGAAVLPLGRKTGAVVTSGYSAVVIDPSPKEADDILTYLNCRGIGRVSAVVASDAGDKGISGLAAFYGAAVITLKPGETMNAGGARVKAVAAGDSGGLAYEITSSKGKIKVTELTEGRFEAASVIRR